MTNRDLESLEQLMRLDPLRSYSERGASAIASFVGAARHTLREDAEPSNASESNATPKRDLQIVLKNGPKIHGVLHLEPPAPREHFSAHEIRRARWAARIFARHLTYAERLLLGAEGNTTRSDVKRALAKSPLTPREKEVVALVVGGATTREIAARTKLTIATIHTYLKRIYPKIGVRSRVELVARVAGTRMTTG